MGVVAEQVLIPDAVPRSLIAALAQSDAFNNGDRPTKRRKVTNSGPYSLAQQRGVSTSGIPLGYIPLARLALRMNFSDAIDFNNEISSDPTDISCSLPVLVDLRSFGASLDDSNGNTEQGQPGHKSWSLELRATDTEKLDFLKQQFNDLQLSNFFQQLEHVTRLTSADRYLSRSPPRACYQASIRLLPEYKCLQLDVVTLWEDSLQIPDFVHLQDPVLEVFAKYALHEYYDCPKSLSGQRERREKLLGYSRAWSPRQFYESVHVPSDTKSASAEIHCPGLACQLFPFQRRAVRWLLRREGVELQKDGKVTLTERSPSDGLPASYKKMKDADGKTCYFSHLFMTITTNIHHWSDATDHLRGGILAEEMGLGKTVEMIALINLNRRVANENVKFDPDGLRPSGATLIITPPAILEQWKQEIEQHAPGLRVHHYTGIKRGQEKSDDLVIEEIADFDVVLTTYNVISREIHYAGAAPKRSLRHEKRFEPRKTPLVRISWWRVCLDEAQMIESGVSNAAKVARLIPRENAWAVTGTPLRKNIDDLFGLLLFLHYRPFSDSSTLWKRLFSRFGPVLVKIINATALRHSKDRVRDELRLPPQKRIVITTPFTAIEEQHYGQLFEEMCEQCGLEASGAPLRDDWNPEDPGTVEKMRTWLTRLRQTCLHPEVSGSNRRALGAANGPLRTVGEVLEVMVENTDTSIRTEERTLLLSQLRRGQLLENAKRRKESLAIWQATLQYSTELVEDSRKQLRLQRLKSKDDNVSNRAGSTDVVDLSDEDNEEVDKNSRIGQCRLRLRAALEVQHIAVFFTANAYYQIKSDPNLTQPDSEEFKALEKKEEEGYEAAKLIRKEMLTDISRKVERYMKIIKEKKQQNQFVQIPKLEPHLYNRGLVSYRLINKLEDLCDALNKHAAQYNEWRKVMVQLVSQSLIDQEEDAELEGNEYERSTKHQDEMYVYMEALRSMYADRHDALTGQKNILISHEVKLGIIQAQKGEGPSPELFLRIMNTRSDLMPDPELGSLRGIVSELRSLVTSLEWQAGEGSSRAIAELEIVGMVLKNAGQMISEQLKVSSSLEREVEMFRDTMNNRLEYYRHLQQISDTVAPYDEENAGKPMNEDIFTSKLEQEEALEKKIASLKSKRRYLIHLRDESGSEDTSRICIICQSSFEVGVLTVCGHKYCTDCLRLWWRAHRTCPMCKKPLKLNDFHQITYKPQDLVAQEEEPPTDFEHERHSQNAIYSDISSGLLKEIKTIDLNGSFGTKIDTLARHVLWLREHDPGTKSIVFSQYKNFLTVLQRAFQRFGIISSSVDAPGGIEKFKKDPAVECFLLHGKAQSSGLTLINATHVFLCEPLINTAIELQAIARVHRIGQHRPTTVWMYLVSGTVEESIYELSVARRLAHIIEKEKQEKKARLKIPVDGDETLIGDLTETAIDSANSMELQDASLNNLMTSGSSGGEMVKKDDLWQCLFGNSTQKDRHGHSTEAEREVGRFLRGEAAEQRREETTS
ncbi:protein BMH2 [Penicillium atrosanguineum]|uniref:protein BMH2 n=1 Tax=Penicillium atrosanguineum TaxID=1132637 RepID=UPI0023A4F2BF|nr:protein BMH2 [Penicillium atrosanguineum]KAJ5298639.1 protein BMH2 [Penicillium atrosanguineum]